MKGESCPGCDSKRVVPGRIFDAISGVKPFYFRPKDLKFITVFKADAKFDGEFHACADCGMLWSTVKTKEIQEIVEKSGTARLKARLKA